MRISDWSSDVCSSDLEDGSGAAAVIADPRFREIAPDLALSLHNLPGLPFGEAVLSEGPVNCASRGMRIVLTGRTAHASMPETGVRSEEHTSELQSLMRISYAVFCLKKKNYTTCYTVTSHSTVN